MADKIPFDEDAMTLIMGLGGPEKPGQHGRTMVPAPDQKAIDIITQIRDLCEEFLQSADKEENEESDRDNPENHGSGDGEESNHMEG